MHPTVGGPSETEAFFAMARAGELPTGPPIRAVRIMKASSMKLLRRASAAAAALALARVWRVSAWAEDMLGQPTPGAIGLQPGVRR